MAGLTVANTIGWVIAAVLIGALVYRVGRSLRTAFGRPGPDTEAVLAHSLAVGRTLLLIAVVLSIWLGRWAGELTGSSGSGIGALGIVALLVVMAAETRWPRQSGAVRVAPLTRPTLRDTIRPTYLIGSSVTLGLTALAAWFFLLIDPTVVGNSVTTSGWWTFGNTTTTSVLVTPDDANCDGCFVGYRTVSTAPVSVGGVWLDCALLVVTAILAMVAVRQILQRRSLVGVPNEVDAALRRVSGRRVLRILTAVALSTVAAWAVDLRNALDFPADPGSSMTRAFSTYLTWISALCIVGVLGLYLMGPNESRMRRAVAAPAEVNGP